MRGATPARCTDLPRDRHRDLFGLIDAAVRNAHPGHLVSRALARRDVVGMLGRAERARVVAAGKAAAPMFSAWCEDAPLPTSRALVTSLAGEPLHPWVTRIASSHPFPDDQSAAAGAAALEMASTLDSDEWLVLLISGGASSMLALPRPGITLHDKVATSRLVMHAGADIVSLNRVRSQLSAIKGGGLARASGGRVVTLAISDVCGVAEDDPSIIGSGPGVVDGATAADAREVLERLGVFDRVPDRVRQLMSAPGECRDLTDARRATHAIIGSRRDAMEGAAAWARERGDRVVVIPEAVTGDARLAAATWLARVRAVGHDLAGAQRVCVISSGETTMQVVGDGVGGRNQEFALAVARILAGDGGPARTGSGDDGRYAITVASIGTDGIDGNSPAAGAIVDATTVARAESAGLNIADVLARNDTFHVFERLGDAVMLGRTQTNVGDLQIALVG